MPTCNQSRPSETLETEPGEAHATTVLVESHVSGHMGVPACWTNLHAVNELSESAEG